MGRPKSFDPDTALESAMEVFWDRGYEAASIGELTDAMGINRFSLYDTFGDKHGLYLSALDRYLERNVEPNAEAIESISTMKGLAEHFDAMIDCITGRPRKCVCLMARSSLEMAADDEETAARIERMYERLHAAYSTCLKNIRRSGELGDRVRIPEAAWSLIMLQGGIISVDHASPPGRAMRGAVRGVLGGLES